MVESIRREIEALPKITPSNLFFALYLLISAATFRHSTIGFASLEGSMFWGGLSALSVDVLMILFAHAIRKNGLRLSWESVGLVIGLIIPALASVYTQLLFSVTEAEILEVASGALWLGQTAVDITNIRVIGLPALLPILAIVAALMGEHDDVETLTLAEHELLLTDERTRHELDKSANKKNLQVAIDQVDNLKSQVATTATIQAELDYTQAWIQVIKQGDWHTAKGLATMAGFVAENGDRPKPGAFAKGVGVTVPAVSQFIKEGERVRHELEALRPKSE